MPTARRTRRKLSPQDDQLELARAVQRSLLPPPLTPTAQFELAARFAPAQAVAGDFYDYFQLSPELVGFYLGDVQGKGLEGAMYAALVSGIMRGVQKTGNQPAHVLDFLNRRLRLRPIPNKFCALAYAIVDLSRLRLTLSNAGLPFPFLCRGSRCTRIELPGFPLGLFDEATYDQVEVALAPGDVLAFYTDGLPDSLESRRVKDGEAVVCEVLETAANGAADQLADTLLACLHMGAASKRTRPLLDDATFLVLKLC